MRLSFALTAALAAHLASAQNTTAPTSAAEFAQGLLAALTTGGFTTLASIVTSVASAPEGIKLLSDLQAGPATLLAPSNGALAGVSANVTGNATLLAEVLSYHLLQGKFDTSSVANAPMHTIARTSLTGSEYANLPNDVGQALVLYQTNGSGIEVQAPYMKWVGRPLNISTGSSSTYLNITLIGLDEVLVLPPTLSQFLTQNASSIAGVLTQANLVPTLEAIKGITAFIPTNEAVTKLGSEAVASLNATALATILSNHVVNGSVLYSTNLASAPNDVYSLAGEKLTFGTNGSSSTVTSGNVTAKITFADIITTNGVVHLIDTVLANPMSNQAVVESIAGVRASSTMAAASGSARASEAGIGPTQGVTGGSSGGGGSAGGSASAGASGAGASASGAGASASARASGAAGGGTGAGTPVIGGGGGGGAMKGVVAALVMSAVAMMWV